MESPPPHPAGAAVFCPLHLDGPAKKRYSNRVSKILTGCCAVGSAPALGAGGREFESRHSDQKKSHDTALEIAFISWLYLLHIGLKMARKCDRIATNLGKTCFVRQCAPLFCATVCAPVLCTLLYIMRLYNGLLYAPASGVSQITIPI